MTRSEVSSWGDNDRVEPTHFKVAKDNFDADFLSLLQNFMEMSLNGTNSFVFG